MLSFLRAQSLEHRLSYHLCVLRAAEEDNHTVRMELQSLLVPRRLTLEEKCRVRHLERQRQRLSARIAREKAIVSTLSEEVAMLRRELDSLGLLPDELKSELIPSLTSTPCTLPPPAPYQQKPVSPSAPAENPPAPSGKAYRSDTTPADNSTPATKNNPTVTKKGNGIGGKKVETSPPRKPIVASAEQNICSRTALSTNPQFHGLILAFALGALLAFAFVLIMAMSVVKSLVA